MFLRSWTFSGAVDVGSHAPSGATVVDGFAEGGAEEAHRAASEVEGNVEESLEVVVAAVDDPSEVGIFELFTAEEASELRILIDVVGVGVVLLVHEPLMLAKLEACNTNSKHDPVVVLSGLEGVAVKQLVVAGEGKALKLETEEDVERNEDGKVCWRHVLLAEGKHVHLVDGEDGEGEDRQILEEPLETFIVRLLHKLKQDLVLEETVALLALGVLDISPVTSVLVEFAEAVGVAKTVERFFENITLRSAGSGDGLEGHLGVRRHLDGGQRMKRVNEEAPFLPEDDTKWKK